MLVLNTLKRTGWGHFMVHALVVRCRGLACLERKVQINAVSAAYFDDNAGSAYLTPLLLIMSSIVRALVKGDARGLLY
eukprot:CAMPEP_0198525950 /NCGR_PEP_ID=MMETSP1462-20131121/23667_1 /TAXON_ID=1333877 /ORGANISM="Brandtodinium nutriculum, Strain RCC3387" /LENGTH=77 /DNA_ID=CAMNT_0044255713 /DNA_START=23 /DNA_END=253 /DNA_ORIENTATION=-